MDNKTSYPLPYYAVIFTATRGEDDPEYDATAQRMGELAFAQPGFLGIEGATDESGQEITISYWQNEADIAHWKKNFEHLAAQKKGKEKWYTQYKIRVCKVEREYGKEL